MNRSQLFLLVLVLGLGGFYYFHDVKGKPEREKAETQSKRLFPSLKRDDIASLSVEKLKDVSDKDHGKLAISQAQGKWTVDGPPAELLNSSQVGDAAKALAEIQKAKEVAPTPAAGDMAEFGLDKPSYRITMKSKDGQTNVLTLGDQTPDGGSYYAQTSEKGPIVSVGSGFRSLLNTTAEGLTNLRETSPMPVDPSKANHVTVTLDNGTKLDASLKTPRQKPSEDTPDDVTITNLSEEWQLNSPSVQDADGAKVRDLIFSWKNLKAARFLKPEEKVSLDKPRLRLEVGVDGRDKPQVLEIGPAVEVNKKLVYARRLDPDETFVVELPNDKLLTPDENTLRNRHLANFEVDGVERVEAKVGDLELAGKKSKDGSWHLQKPTRLISDEGQQKQAVTDFLWAIKNCEWSEQPKDAKIDKPRATVKLFIKDDKQVGSITLGQAQGKGALVQLKDGGPVYLIADDPYSKWEANLNKLVPAATPTPGTAPGSATPGAPAPGAGIPSPGGAIPFAHTPTPTP